MSDALISVLLDELERSPGALQRLRELVGDQEMRTSTSTAPVFTVPTLANQLGRSERSIRAAIGRGELAAVKRGRGWIVSAAAVAEWATSQNYDLAGARRRGSRRQGRNSANRRSSGPGPMRRALSS